MKFGKTIKIFLIDGEPNGRMSCELSNWTGKAYKIPRIKIRDCADRKDLNNTGIYLLLGKNDEGKDLVYIGETETILDRLKQQLSKEFWNETITFISKDDNLNKAHIKYLESRLYDIASQTKRYKIENSTSPTQSSISESDIAEMEEFIDNIKIIVNTLGHKLFEKIRENRESSEVREITEVKEIKAIKEVKEVKEVKPKQNDFFIKNAVGVDGKGMPTSEGFVVFKGSKARLDDVNIPKSSSEIKEKLISEKILVRKGHHYEFTDDYIFSSPTTAAIILVGRSANGYKDWKLKDGTTLRDFESK